MNWERINQYYWQSDRGYRISKAKVRGLVKYSGWRPRVDLPGGPFVVLDDASAWCDRRDQHVN